MLVEAQSSNPCGLPQAPPCWAPALLPDRRSRSAHFRTGWRGDPLVLRKHGNAGRGKGPQLRQTKEATKDMEIDDESSHPWLCSEVADGVTRDHRVSSPRAGCGKTA